MDDWWAERAAILYPRFQFTLQSTATGSMFDDGAVISKNPKLSSPDVQKPQPVDGRSDWNGTTSSDFNTGANWTPAGPSPGGAPPSAGDVAWFTSTPTNKSVNLSSSVSIAGLYFNGTGASGYSLTRSGTTQTFTLTANGTSIGAETGDASAVAIGAENTSGTNTIAVPITLAPVSGSISTIFQATGGTLTLSGVISGTGINLTKTGGGTLTLSGNNTFSGGLTIKAGTVSATGGSANSLGGSGSGAITLGDTSGSASATLLGGANNYGNPISVSGGSSGTLTIGNNGNSSAIFSGAVMLNNNLTLAASGTGTVKLSGGVTGTGDIILNNTTTNTVIFLQTTLVNNSGTIASFSSGTGLTTIDSTLGGNVTQVIQNSSTSVLRLSMSMNTAFVGDVLVNAGTVEINNSASALNSANAVFVAGGATFDLNGNNQTIAGLGTGTGTVTNTGSNARTLTLGGSGTYSFGGVVTANTTNRMIVVKSGSGTQTLSGTNTYTGTTTVNAGKLYVNGSLASGSTVSVNNSGTVLGGTGTINGPVTVNANAKLQGGDETTGTTLTLAGNLTLADNSIVQLALGPSGAHSTLARTGGTWTFDSNQAFAFINLGATPGTYQDIITGLAADPGTTGSWIITSGGFAGSFAYDGLGNIDLTLTLVPEPSTWVGGMMALGVIATSQRRRIARLVRGSA